MRFINLKAWRAEVAREHGLPAYVIFHDATLAAIAERCPATLADLEGISGMGAKKLEVYGGMCCGCVEASREHGACSSRQRQHRPPHQIFCAFSIRRARARILRASTASENAIAA